MVTIDINNSISKINNLSAEQFKALRKVLSYQADAQAAYFSGAGFQRFKYCIDAKGYFATGLLKRVKDFCCEAGIPFRTQDTRAEGLLTIKKVSHFYKAGHQPYRDQLDAALFVERHRRAIISMPTGSGKSLVAALITSRFSVRTLIVVPSLQIKEQFTADFKELFGDMSNIIIENIDSSALKTATDYDLLIIDEAHHVAAKTYQKLNRTAWKGIYYRVFLTATPFRNNTEETMLFEGIAGSNVFTLSYKDAVKKGYIVPLEAYYIEIPKQETEAYTWSQVYSELVVNHKSRNETITRLLIALAQAGISTLCLVKEIQHGNNLVDLMPFMFANGQDEDTRGFINQFSSGKLCTLIGTEGILGEGVDTRACEYVVIAGLGKAKSSLMQKFGRAVRKFKGKESGKIILILDRSHKFTLKHYREQVKILKDEYGITPQKLEM